MWRIIGTSVPAPKREGDASANQDAFFLEQLNDGQAVMVLCDGAGSQEQSRLGAKFVAAQTGSWLAQNCFEDDRLTLSAECWANFSYQVLRHVRHELEAYAQELEVEVKSLACTVIALVVSHSDLFLVHIGDGRAGYKVAGEDWQPLMTPFQGHQAGSTCFLTSQKVFADGGVSKFLESQYVQHADLEGFCLMTDGCEHLFFQTVVTDPENPQVFLPDSTPHAPALDPALEMIKNSADFLEDIRKFWSEYLVNEPIAQTVNDDKTLVLAWRKKTDGAEN